jgi:hypothetical protein
VRRLLSVVSRLHGTEPDRFAPRRRVIRVSLAVSALGAIALMLYWLAQL